MNDAVALLAKAPWVVAVVVAVVRVVGEGYGGDGWRAGVSRTKRQSANLPAVSKEFGKGHLVCWCAQKKDNFIVSAVMRLVYVRAGGSGEGALATQRKLRRWVDGWAGEWIGAPQM